MSCSGSYEDMDCRGGYDESNRDIENSMKVHLCIRCGENQVRFNGGMCEGCEKSIEEEEAATETEHSRVCGTVSEPVTQEANKRK